MKISFHEFDANRHAIGTSANPAAKTTSHTYNGPRCRYSGEAWHIKTSRHR
jgi:hypothetical protein